MAYRDTKLNLLQGGFLALPLLLLLVFFYIPLGNLFSTSLTADTIRSLLSDRAFFEIFSFTILQAVLSTLLSAAIGLFGAYWIGNRQFRGKAAIKKLSLLPFVLPPIIVVFAFIQFWGAQGWMTWVIQLFSPATYPDTTPLYSLWGIVLAHAFYNSCLYMRIVGGVWEGLDPTLENAARSLGASPIRAFLKITCRRLLPATIQATIITFLLCSTSFVIILCLGGHPRFTTLEVAIYEAVRVELNVSNAARLGLVQALVGILLFVLTLPFLRQRETWVSKKMNPLRGWVWAAFGLFIIVWFLSVLGPLLAYALHLITIGLPNLLSLTRNDAFWLALENSLIVALSSAALSTALAAGLAVFHRKIAAKKWRAFSLRAFILLPTAISSILSSLALLVVFGNRVDFFSGTLIAIIVVHAVITLPFVFQITLPYMNFVSNSLLHSGKLLGASTLQLVRGVVLPLISRGLLTGFLIAFGLSMGEMGAVMMFYSERNITLPVLMYHEISHHEFSDASLVGGVILLISLLCFYALSSSEKEQRQ